MGKKIIYMDASLKTLTYKQAVKLKHDAEMTIGQISKSMNITSKHGQPVSISVRIDANMFDKPVGLEACARIFKNGNYEIQFGIGFIARLFSLASAITADPDLLRGCTRAKISSPKIKNGDIQKVLSGFAFHYMTVFIFYHELAHVFLGHLDWLSNNAKLNVLDEFRQELSIAGALQKQTMEGDADRQASVWTASLIDYTLADNPYVKYENLEDAFYDIGVIYGALFCMLDSLDTQIPDEKRSHPDAHVRLKIALSSVTDYLQKYQPRSAANLQKEVDSGGSAGFGHFLHKNVHLLNLSKIARFIATNGDRIAAMNIRKYQHKMTVSSTSSIEIY